MIKSENTPGAPTRLSDLPNPAVTLRAPMKRGSLCLLLAGRWRIRLSVSPRRPR